VSVIAGPLHHNLSHFPDHPVHSKVLCCLHWPNVLHPAQQRHADSAAKF